MCVIYGIPALFETKEEAEQYIVDRFRGYEKGFKAVPSSIGMSFNSVPGGPLMFFQCCVRATTVTQLHVTDSVQWDLVQLQKFKVQTSNSVGVCEQKNGRVPKGNDKKTCFLVAVSCHNFPSAEEPQQERTPPPVDDKYLNGVCDPATCHCSEFVLAFLYCQDWFSVPHTR